MFIWELFSPEPSLLTSLSGRQPPPEGIRPGNASFGTDSPTHSVAELWMLSDFAAVGERWNNLVIQKLYSSIYSNLSSKIN